MSRWVDKFNKYNIRENWDELKELLELSEADETTESIEELARLKKVVSFMNNAFKGIDSELVSESFLEEFSVYSRECIDEIDYYNENKNIRHTKEANKCIDKLLDCMRPYIIHSGKLKKSLLDSMHTYSNEINKRLTHVTDTEIEYKKAKEYRKEIEKYHNLLFNDDNESKSIKLQIATFLEDTKEKYEKINTFYSETLSDNEEDTTKAKIIEAKKDILKDVKEANDKLTSTSNKIDDLNKFYIKIFGSKDDDETVKDGLEQKLDKDLDTLKDLQTEQEEVHNTLRAEIESLLPGATSVGLAKAYQDMKKSFKTPIYLWSGVFLSSLASMILSSWFSYTEMKNLSDIINSLLSKLPLYIPLVWLAIFASKRISENKRLEQEYAHKEAMAKSYMSYKEQIDSLKKEDNSQLLEKLLNSSIDILSRNASESLDKNHDDSTPIIEVAKRLKESISKQTP